MAEQALSTQDAAAPAAVRRQSGGVVSGIITGAAVLMVVEGVILYWLFAKPSAERTGPAAPYSVQGEGTQTPDDLRAPSVEVKDVTTSVKIDPAGNRMRNLVVSVSIRLGRDQSSPEDHLNLKLLEKQYLPNIEKFVPEFKHMLLEEISRRDYAKLQDPAERQKMLDELRMKCNDRLNKQYGLEPRIAGIYIQTFCFD